MVNFVSALTVKQDRAEQLAQHLDGLDPCDFRDWSSWFRLARECCHAGVSRQAWIDWCKRDPKYAGDAKRIGRVWDSLSKHKR